jgi:hypothetical protein
MIIVVVHAVEEKSAPVHMRCPPFVAPCVMSQVFSFIWCVCRSGGVEEGLSNRTLLPCSFGYTIRYGHLFEWPL